MNSFLKILPVILAVCAVSCSKTGFSIKGKYGNSNGKAALAYTDPDSGSVRDTVAMSGGTFVFTGEISKPANALVNIIPDGETPISLRLIVENGKIKFDVAPEDITEANRGRRTVVYPRVYGSPNNDFVTGQQAIRDKFGDDTEALDSAMVEYALAHPDVEMAAHVFRISADYLSTTELEAAFNSFTPKVQQSQMAERLREKLAARKATEPGATAPDFTLKGLDGQNVTLSSFRGQYVLLDFWASWCVPCREGMPAMKELYAKYHDKGFEIIGISDDSKEKNWRQAVEEDGTPWVHTVDEFREKGESAVVISMYGVHYIPTYILLDKEGRIIGRMEHDELAAKLAELIGE